MIKTFSRIGQDDLPLVGGKGMNLGLLTRAGFPVPPGFCLTTRAYRAFVAGCGGFPALLDALDAMDAEDVARARVLGAQVREALLAVSLPSEVEEAVVAAWQEIGAEHPFAVRSSATAEDLPGASFAGQQDTYLGIRGRAALLDAVRRCMASLFTDRAILYRARNGFGHRGVALSVVVQRMITPDAAGILFTADPVTGHRGTLTLDAGFGLGEALVGGLVTADLYRVDRRARAVKEVRVGDKVVAIRPVPGGGTVTEELSPERRHARVLTDAQVLALADLGGKVEAYYGGAPQDVEWCIEGEEIFLVQARPITSLYPLVEGARGADGVRLYFSFSHGQNMTDPLTPLGLDLWRRVAPFGKARLEDLDPEQTVMKEAGGRLFVDITAAMRVPPMRAVLRRMLGAIYPDLAAGMEALADRPDVQRASPPERATLRMALSLLWSVPLRLLRQLVWEPLEQIPQWGERFVREARTGFVAQVEASPAGPSRIEAAWRGLATLFTILPSLPPRIGGGLIALGKLRARFAGTPHAADVEALQRGLVGNVTTEMDLQVGDLADTVRPWPELLAALRGLGGRPLSSVAGLPGGRDFLKAFEGFLERFGMRGQAEIDIGRPRWRDEPGLLINSIVSLASQGEQGAHRRHFTQLQAAGEEAGQRLVAAAGGPISRWWVGRLVGSVRYGLGVREHPKFLLIQCIEVARQLALAVGDTLVAAGRLDRREDVFFLKYPELLALAGDPRSLEVAQRVKERRAEYAHQKTLTPPIVVTSEGEIAQLPRPKDLPPGALSGLGASAGVIEGRARVVLDPSTEILAAGEILVAPYTDPGWTPLFVHAAGLVCDVGGMMTHGSVIAREYGIPAVVGVGDGTRRLKTGQLLRVDGGRGIVEVLGEGT